MAALGDFFARIFGSKDTPQLGLTPSELEADWLIVGLGNPGAKYAATRHNVGYMAIDDLLAAGGDVLEPVRGLDPDHVIVLHDELDLPANKVRLKQGGNENGHNGLKSLTERLGTRDYLRVRIGIARPPKGSSIPDYVLGPVDAGTGFDTAIATAAESARLIVTEGLGKAQNQIHSR